jgi:hypothetical protein
VAFDKMTVKDGLAGRGAITNAPKTEIVSVKRTK